eukprot:TRINITY_DN2313_c0_g1_i1.p1 TRINITY_DN2313_c0_g1~~TRINITY_DN2313_c0_g1_i1.p1  ORF type:complete len:176 (+),score=46.35 TRINITY_DN2313_c0_g1_i1:30-557(+)
MGSHGSTLGDDELEELQKVSKFTPNQLKKLYRRFQELDTDNSGRISTTEFYVLPELAMNPLRSRVLAIFDRDLDNQVNFKEFVSTLSVFSPQADRMEKLKFAFNVYDTNQDGFIDKEELTVVLQLLVGTNLEEGQLNSIVDKTFREANVDDKITFSKFCDLMKNSDVVSDMTLKF